MILSILVGVFYDLQGHKVMRLDGTVTHTYEREQIIKKWQKDSSYSVFLLTTQVK